MGDPHSETIQLAPFRLYDAMRVPDDVFQDHFRDGRLTAGVASLNTALEHAKRAVFTVFGHDCVVEERYPVPNPNRALGLHDRADLELNVTFKPAEECTRPLSTGVLAALDEPVPPYPTPPTPPPTDRSSSTAAGAGSGAAEEDWPTEAEWAATPFRNFVARIGEELKPFYGDPVPRVKPKEPEEDEDEDEDEEDGDESKGGDGDGDSSEQDTRLLPNPQHELSLRYLVPLTQPFTPPPKRPGPSLVEPPPAAVPASAATAVSKPRPGSDVKDNNWLVSMTLFPRVKGVDEPRLRLEYETDDRRPRDYEPLEGEEEGQPLAKKAAILLLKLYMYDWYPEVRPWHIVWGLEKAVETIAVSFAHVTFRGRVCRLMKQTLFNLNNAYYDLSQPTMFRIDLGFRDDMMMVLGDAMEWLRHDMTDVLEPDLVRDDHPVDPTAQLGNYRQVVLPEELEDPVETGKLEDVHDPAHPTQPYPKPFKTFIWRSA